MVCNVSGHVIITPRTVLSKLYSVRTKWFGNWGSQNTSTVYTFFLFVALVWDWLHLVRLPLFRLLYQPWMMDDDEYGAVGGLIGRGNRSYTEKTCPTAAVSTTNPTWRDPCSNRDLRGGKPATNLLNYRTASVHVYKICVSCMYMYIIMDPDCGDVVTSTPAMYMWVHWSNRVDFSRLPAQTSESHRKQTTSVSPACNFTTSPLTVNSNSSVYRLTTEGP
jgi:hypothetical protein